MASNPGILFLTTNLPQTIDPAIESRIHINLPFPALTQPFRVGIWQHFLATVPKDLKSLSKADIRELGQWNINGRQIKNAFRMCGAYCKQERKKISLENLEDMIGMSCPSAKKEPRDPAVGGGDDLRDDDENQPEIKPTAEPETTTNHIKSSSSSFAHGSGSMQENTPNGGPAHVGHAEEQTVSSPARPSLGPKRPPPLPVKPKPTLTSLGAYIATPHKP
jgi:hypothetical protein